MSIQLLEPTLEKQRRICGPTHPETHPTMHQLALNYFLMDRTDRLEESMDLHQKILDAEKAAGGPGYEPNLWPMITFAVACQRAGKLDRADQLLREALEHIQKRADAIVHQSTRSNILGWLSRNLVLQEKYEEAEPLIRQSVAWFKLRQPDAIRGFYWMTIHGAVLVGQKRYTEAEPLLLQGYLGMKQHEAIAVDQEWRQLAEVGERIVRFYEVTNQPEKAREWREKLSPMK
jgi:tetratricopeptide (TPR) repeat protein